MIQNGKNIEEEINSNDSNKSDARMRGAFDTLHLYKKGKPTDFVPRWDGNTHPAKPEPFAAAYPEYGKGGAVQLHADGQVVNFDSIEILSDQKCTL